jgi:hypothetical protein
VHLRAARLEKLGTTTLKLLLRGINTMDFFTDKIVIVRGSKKSINLYFLYEKTQRPYPINGVTEIEVSFPKATGVVTKTKTGGAVTIVGVADLGQILVELSEADTAGLKLCAQGIQGLSFSAKLTFPAGIQIFNFANLLFVEDPAVVPAV